MLIEWKGSGPLAIGDPRKSNYKLAAVIVCTPGISKIEDEVWNGSKDKPGVKDNPEIKKMIEKGEIIVMRDKSADAETAAKKGEAVDLFGLKVDEAKSFVEKTMNMELLESWAETETRPKVRRAIEKQISELTIAKKKEE